MYVKRHDLTIYKNIHLLAGAVTVAIAIYLTVIKVQQVGVSNIGIFLILASGYIIIGAIVGHIISISEYRPRLREIIEEMCEKTIERLFYEPKSVREQISAKSRGFMETKEHNILGRLEENFKYNMAWVLFFTYTTSVVIILFCTYN